LKKKKKKVHLSSTIQWGGCYDVERRFEREPTVVLRTAKAHYHLKNPAMMYFSLFNQVLRKISLVSTSLRIIYANQKSSLPDFWNEVDDLFLLRLKVKLFLIWSCCWTQLKAHSISEAEFKGNLKFLLAQVDILNLQAIEKSPLLRDLRILEVSFFLLSSFSLPLSSYFVIFIFLLIHVIENCASEERKGREKKEEQGA